jgi:hypothetical protein
MRSRLFSPNRVETLLGWTARFNQLITREGGVSKPYFCATAMSLYSGLEWSQCASSQPSAKIQS